MRIKPDVKTARKVLPTGVRKAIEFVFDQGVEGVALVGGTALAGYYAGHRQSDDMDLFVIDEAAHDATVRAVESLTKIGARKLQQIQKTRQIYKALFENDSHQFTVDVVLDPNLHATADFAQVGTLIIAKPFDLLRMKMATLVSRCSEKDLYDLIWLFEQFRDLSLADKMAAGQAIDGGLSLESALISLSNCKPRKDACGFCQDLGKSASKVLKEVEAFRKELIRELTALIRKQESRTGLAEIKKSLN